MNKKFILIILSLFYFQAYGQDHINVLIDNAERICRDSIFPKYDSLIKLEKDYNDLLSQRNKFKGNPKDEQAKLEEISKRNSDLLNRLNKEIENLKNVQSSVRKVILDKYEPYLNESLSVIDSVKLHNISIICKVYKGVDKEINGFYNKVDSITTYKKNYERARTVCASKFNCNDVETSLRELNEIKNVNDVQRNDINLIIKQLTYFAPGVKYLQDFIVSLNKMREDKNYILEDLVFDREFIWENMNVEFDIMNVPYLKQVYAQYMTILEADPMAHPQIEEEILAL